MVRFFFFFSEKVYFKSQILVHEYWTILDHFGVPVLFASGCHQHVLKNVNITFPGNTGTHEMFQYPPILGRSSIWDLKYTFSFFSFVCLFYLDNKRVTTFMQYSIHSNCFFLIVKNFVSFQFRVDKLPLNLVVKEKILTAK